MSSLWRSVYLTLPQHEQLLNRFYHELMIPNFPIQTELEPLDVWRDELQSQSKHHPSSAERSRAELHIVLAFEKKPHNKSSLMLMSPVNSATTATGNDTVKKNAAASAIKPLPHSLTNNKNATADRNEVVEDTDSQSSTLLGGIVYEYFRVSNCVLITYLVISPTVRGQGAGLFLSLEAWKGMKRSSSQHGHQQPAAIFCEVNDPTRISDSQDAHSPIERIRAFQTMGVRTFSKFPYVQPPLHDHLDRCYDMLLSVVVGPMTQRDDKGNAFVPNELLKNFVVDFWSDYLDNPHQDKDVQKMLAYLDAHPNMYLEDFDLSRFKTCARRPSASSSSSSSLSSTSSTAVTPSPSTLLNMSGMTVDRHVVVVGAGLSGLACARVLQQNGYRVTIIEARTRLGGRVYTSRSFGTRVDFGASWIHGVEGNPLADFVARELPQLKMCRSEDENATLYDSNGKPIPHEVLFEAYTTHMTNLEAMHGELSSKFGESNPCPVSLSQALTEYFAKNASSCAYQSSLHKQATNYFVSSIESLQAAAAHELSAKDFAQGTHYEGGDQLVPEGFFQIVLKLADGLNIVRGKSVKHIQYKGNADKGQRVSVSFSDRTAPLQADAVVVTVPIGVLQKQLISFEPALPSWKQSAISQIGAGISNRIILRFDKVFWPPTDFLSYNHVIHDKYRVASESGSAAVDEDLQHSLRDRESIFFFNHSKVSGEGDHAPLLIAIVNGDVARRFESLPDKEVVNQLVERLQHMFGKEKVSSVVESHITRWGMYPTSHCAYSFCKVGCSPHAFEEVGKPVDDTVFFCGEHTSAHRFGYADGAYETGLREAERIMNLFAAEAKPISKL